ncbi:SDR family NAD(P)-dependent oxidoreductase [Rhodococcoides corynebacterioides]|uniref:SDR family NAD(P)-dependent oxidoreductase n=1 Tax=Rhodococcoides corynebacterioides TaxID=53972 RepID=UPI001C9A7509|nr:SDR family oxidoreductase [Rhodococcus corynebacterioides]MBY6362817.1 SDR family oxidoreductase [Rhodococcus corynebacterioides]
MDLGIKGRTAVVTGADSGIGWCTAQMLLDEGVRVVVSDKDEQKLTESAGKLTGPDGAVTAVAADVTDPASVAELHRRAVEALGSVDILVQSAGVTGAQGLFHEIDDDGWASTVEIDLLGPVRLIRAFLPELRQGGWGRIVLLASEDAEQPYVDELPYCAAKAGILSLTKGLSKTYASEGVLVNAVSPAFIHTPMTDAMMDKRADERGTDRDEAIESFLKEERPFMELGRRGTPEEVAAVVTFLCSERAAFVNGSNYRVDSGSVATI